ncbi:MAG TPA: BTAD domain-containing putative transcriptional regulator [Marmoricola sp.]|nr:BTAD domain-containing putative transcriptional regulator [Marmoricola sp.]
MGIGVLGPLLVDGAPPALPRRDRVVLEALAVERGTAVAADRLADALWRESPPASWSKVVQSSIVRLRKELGRETIQTLPEGYRLTLPMHEIDACEFERLVDRAREQLLLGQAERAAYTLDEALRLWRGRPLGELDEWESGRTEADRLEELRRDAEELRCEARLEAGHHRELLMELQRLVRAAPLRERRWELLALAEYRTGRQSDALRTIRQVKQLLLDELGLDPGPGLLTLEQSILRQDDSLAATVTAEPAARSDCPYLGLVPYDVGDADTFFGRDRDVAACLERLQATGVLAVVGPSGSGKSSLIRAGVAATRRGQGTRVVVISPGARPRDSLTAVPARPNGVLLVVDQCEEVLSLCADRDEQGAFFAALAAHAETGGLVLALRADRLGELASFPAATRLVERGLYLLNPMAEGDLRAAIEAPARQAGLRIEPGLVELLIAEVGGEPGALPLLSHVLRETWVRREGALLTVDGYRATGGVRHAVAESAESLYEQLPVEHRPMLRDLLLRLVSPSPDGEPVRARVPRRLVATDEAHERLIESLVGARLVTVDEGVLELAHEAVSRAWPRMRGWLDEDTEGQRIRRHLAVAADTWSAMGRPDTELYRGVRLARALEWQARSAPDLVPAEEEFLAAGRRLAEVEERTALQQARDQKRVNRRLRGLLVGSAALLVAALVASGLAVRQADRATEAGRVADARRVAAQALVIDRPDEALQRAVAAVSLDNSVEARAGLRSVLARVPELAAYFPAPRGWMELRGDGTQLAIMGDDQRVTVLDTSTGEELGSYDPNRAGWQGRVACVCQPLAWSGDGDLLAIGVLNGIGPAVRLVDTSTYDEAPIRLGGLPNGDRVASDLEFSADGRILAATVDGPDTGDITPGGIGTAFVWDLEDPSTPRATIPLIGSDQALALSADGSRLITVPDDNWDTPTRPGTMWDTVTGRRIRGYPDLGVPLALSPDDSLLAYAHGRDTVLVSPTTGEEQRRLSGHREPVEDLAFDPAGEQLVTDGDGTVIVWGIDGRVRHQIELDAGMLALGPHGRDLYLHTADGVDVVDLAGTRRYLTQTSRPHRRVYDLGGVSFFPSPDGEAVVQDFYEPEDPINTRLIELDTGRRTGLGDFAWVGTEDKAVSWRPDSRRVAAVDGSGRIRVVERRTGRIVARGRVDAADFDAWVEYTSDGRSLLAGSDQGLVVLDAATLDEAGPPVHFPGRNVAFAVPGPEDGTAVVFLRGRASSAWDFTDAHTWALVDVRTGEVLREGQVDTSVESAAVSPDGRRLALGGHPLVIVDLRSGETTTPTEGGPEATQFHVRWAPDGSRVVSTGDGLVHVWDGKTGQLLGDVGIGTDASAVFLADSRTVSIVGWDGATYQWQTSLQHALDVACRVAGGGLSREEWATVLPEQPYQATCG